MNEAENCEVLFEYLRKILYDTDSDRLDLSAVDEPYRRLARGMQYLHQAVSEMQQYSADLSTGKLSEEFPSQENPLCANLKTLHANLNHLTWQARRVSMGDYSQHVSYLGAFSDAFNTMIQQLKERESQLKEQMREEQRRAEMLEDSNRLIVNIMNEHNERMLVFDAETGEVLYYNKMPGPSQTDPYTSGKLTWQELADLELSDILDLLRSHTCGSQENWELEASGSRYYRVTSFATVWNKRPSNVHILEDITEEKRKTSELTSIAYQDGFTGIFNRRYFTKYMNAALQDQLSFTFCFLDLDCLKYVNDHYGHNEGDLYIMNFVRLIQRFFRSDDIVARLGGDEFGLILPQCSCEIAQQKLQRALDIFISENKAPYPVSFSYGVVTVDENNTKTAKEILHLADEKMYKRKHQNKQKFHDTH